MLSTIFCLNCAFYSAPQRKSFGSYSKFAGTSLKFRYASRSFITLNYYFWNCWHLVITQNQLSFLCRQAWNKNSSESASKQSSWLSACESSFWLSTSSEQGSASYIHEHVSKTAPCTHVGISGVHTLAKEVTLPCCALWHPCWMSSA